MLKMTSSFQIWLHFSLLNEQAVLKQLKLAKYLFVSVKFCFAWTVKRKTAALSGIRTLASRST